ncbi:UNVERIFIED_ORG: hypothetical protein OKW15_001075 [Pseudomonas reinekei]|nr:hypothetical protein [Pseudomonas reinekei]
MDYLKTAPLRFLLLVSGTWLAIFFLTRTVLLLTHLDEAGSGFLSVFGIGLLYDLGFIAYAALPMGLYLLLCPPALWRTPWPSLVSSRSADRQSVRDAVHRGGRVAVLG